MKTRDNHESLSVSEFWKHVHVVRTISQLYERMVLYDALMDRVIVLDEPNPNGRQWQVHVEGMPHVQFMYQSHYLCRMLEA